MTTAVTTKLELDSSMSLDEIHEAIADQIYANEDCTELSLNDLDLDEFATCAAITRLLQTQQQQTWNYIGVEECTGRHLDMLLTVVFATTKVRKLKLTSIYNRLEESSLFAMALGLNTNQHLEEFFLSTSLTAQDADILAQGLASSSASSLRISANHNDTSSPSSSSSSLKRLVLWDCALADVETAQCLSQALKCMPSLQEFGLVACGPCEERLAALLEGFESSKLQKLDLRCLACGIQPVVDFLSTMTTRSLQSLDLSFKSGEEPLNVALLANALPATNLQALHLCKNYLTDEDLVVLLNVIPQTRLQTLNLSLNKITDVGIQQLARRIENDNLHLIGILLDGNPIQDPQPLLEAILTNTYLEECCIPQDFEECQQMLHFYTRLNRGGRRLVMGHTRDEEERLQVPMGLWPLVLERANRLDFDNCANSNGRAEVLYCLLHGPVLFPF